MPRIYNRRSIEYTTDDNNCHICTSHRKDKDGYPTIKVKGKTWRMSRYIYTQSYGEIPDGAIVRHICDNRGCINLSHLILGTQADNMRDASIRNRLRPHRGEQHPRAKLTLENVEYIRQSTETHAELARRFGVSERAISKVRKGLSW